MQIILFSILTFSFRLPIHCFLFAIFFGIYVPLFSLKMSILASSFIILFLICPNCFPKMPNNSTSLNHHLNFLLTVKTTRANHSTRLKEVIQSWAKEKPSGLRIIFVSDWPFPSAKFELIDSGCPSGHQNAALCCKLATELRLALEQGPKFWCHFDDDSFVILPNLMAHFRQFSPKMDLYIGRASISEPISLSIDQKNDSIFEQKFWFGTGGAGYCLSQSTLGKLRPFLDDFESICDKLGTPDDVTLGFVLSNLLKINLTNSELFHSHLEMLHSIPQAILDKQISLSGSVEAGNFVDVPTAFPHFDDPLRFMSIQRFLKKQKKDEGRIHNQLFKMDGDNGEYERMQRQRFEEELREREARHQEQMENERREAERRRQEEHRERRREYLRNYMREYMRQRRARERQQRANQGN